MSDPIKPTFHPSDRALHELCSTFPNDVEREISRDHLIDTYESVFSQSVDLLVLQGEPGIGKTNLLSQFARRHPKHIVCSFVPPMGRLNYDHQSLRRDYCAQLHAILHPGKRFDPHYGRDGILENLIQKLSRRRGKATYYFLLDGLTDIKDPIIMSEVARLLPIGHGFPVMISADPRKLPSDLIARPATQTTLAVRFSLSEVHHYFGDLELAHADVRDLYQSCGKGIPAHLASVRRSLLGGADISALRHQDILNLYEQEWRYSISDALSERIVAIVAHSRHRLTTQSITEVLQTDYPTLSDRLRTLRFLQVDPETSYISFVSGAFAEFAANKLSDTKKRDIGLLVRHASARRTEDQLETLDTVPAYLYESGRLADAISFLTPDYFSIVLKRDASFAPLRQQFDIGMDAALTLRQDGDLFRLGLEGSALREISTAQVSRSELEALVTIGRGSQALALATNCPLREDRLHTLAVVARTEKERGTPLGDDVLDQIRQLHSQIEPKSLSNKAIDIAADLFPSCPDLALSLIPAYSRSSPKVG